MWFDKQNLYLVRKPILDQTFLDLQKLLDQGCPPPVQWNVCGDKPGRVCHPGHWSLSCVDPVLSQDEPCPHCGVHRSRRGDSLDHSSKVNSYCFIYIINRFCVLFLFLVFVLLLFILHLYPNWNVSFTHFNTNKKDHWDSGKTPPANKLHNVTSRLMSNNTRKYILQNTPLPSFNTWMTLT